MEKERGAHVQKEIGTLRARAGVNPANERAKAKARGVDRPRKE